jgi:hypothetical protein
MSHNGGYINTRLPSLPTWHHIHANSLWSVNQCKLSHDYQYLISYEQNGQTTGGKYREVCWSRQFLIPPGKYGVGKFMELFMSSE